MNSIIKLTVTALLLFFLIRMADPAQLRDLLDHTNPYWILAAMALIALNIVADALLFANIMKSQGHHIELKVSLAYCLVGWFFGNLAPSSVGTDLFRTAQMRRLGLSTTEALRVVLNYRLMSFAALTVFIAAGIQIGLPFIPSAPERITLIVTAAVGAAALLGAIFVGFSVRLQAMAQRSRFLSPVATVTRDLANISFRNEHSLSSWAYAAVQHFIRILIIAALARSLNLDIPFAILFAFVPLSLLIAMIPISLASWGVREISFVYFLGLAGVPLESALYLSIGYGLLRIIYGIIGGVFWALTQKDAYRIGHSNT